MYIYEREREKQREITLQNIKFLQGSIYVEAKLPYVKSSYSDSK